jgi:hypothetical protein
MVSTVQYGQFAKKSAIDFYVLLIAKASSWTLVLNFLPPTMSHATSSAIIIVSDQSQDFGKDYLFQD